MAIQERPDFMSEEFYGVLMEKTGALKSTQTAANYIGAVMSLCRYCGKDFLSLTREDVDGYFRSIETRKKFTRSSRLTIFRSVAKEADRRLGTDTLQRFNVNLERPELAIEASQLPANRDVDAALSYLSKSGDVMLTAVIATVLETGLSTSEICGLKIGNVLIEGTGRPLLRLEPAVEDGMYRNIPLTKGTAGLIAKAGLLTDPSRRTAQDSLFVNRSGDPLTERTLQIRLRDACRKAGVKAFTLQELRSLAVAHMMKGGATADMLSYQLGVTDNWFFRLDHAVRDLDMSAAGCSHLRIKP